MDKDLVRQSLSYHGPTLLSLLRCEQHEHAGFKQLLGDLSKWPQYRKERNVNNVEIQHFIARKADLLFSLSWKSNTQENADSLEPSQGYSAVMPPLEQFMDVPNEEKKELFFRDVERGDVVIGKISSIRDFGFFVVLLAMGSGILRDLTTLEINALCPVRDVPSQSSHGDPLSYYQIGDLIQAAVKDIDRYHEKLTLSLHKSALPTHLSSVKLGVITTDDMPDYYKQSAAMSVSNVNNYEAALRQSLAFSNPSTVESLLGKLGLSESNPPSLIRGLQRENFSDQDFAASLRKKQSSSWALKCVKLGVDYFKVGRHVDAMNEYNKALEIDAQNVEALVARGALYATKGSLNKAIHDFEVALENCPTHRNARKYLCQTLVERGGQLEEEDKLLNAESYYSKALTVDKTFTEAEEALNKLRLCKQKSLGKREKPDDKRDDEKTNEKKIETSAEKLRKLLKEEKRKRKRRQRSSSSSSSSSDTSCSSDSSSYSNKKHKKKRQKRNSESSSQSKKYTSSAHTHKHSYSPPADTSASFLSHKSDVKTVLEESGRAACRRRASNESARYRSLSSSSLEIVESYGGRSEDSRDSYSSEKTQASTSKTCSEDKCTNSKSSRRVSTDSYFKNTKNRYDSSNQFQGQRYSNRKSESGSAERLSRSKNSRSLPLDPPHIQSTNQLGNEKPHNGNTSVSKDLPGNLLNILSQIAEFEKEKGSRQQK